MRMKKSINSSENPTSELLEGFAEVHKDLVVLGENRTVINKNLNRVDCVTIMTQGGSGREPAINGFIGDGMMDAPVVDDVLAAPRPQACADTVKLADKGKDVLYIVLNRAGDMLTGNLIMKKCTKEGLHVAEVVTQENVPNVPRPDAEDRRGLVGCIPTHKTAGAAAAKGRSLEEMTAVAQRFAGNMTILAAAVSGATHPAAGSLPADLGEDEMEISMGQYGEGGDGRQLLKSADETAIIMIDALLAGIGTKEDEKATLILNGAGAATLVELFIPCRKCASCLREKNIEIAANYVGELLAVQEQGGFQMLTARMDGEPLHYWNAPYNTPYMKKQETAEA